MKRIFACLLCMILIVLCLPVVATAEEHTSVEAKTEAGGLGSYVKVGETVTLQLVLQSEVEVKSGAISFDLDDTAFELVRVQWGPALHSAPLIFFNDETQQGVFAFSTPTRIWSVLISVDLRALAVTQTDFVMNLQLKDANNQDITVTVTPKDVGVSCNHNHTIVTVPPTCNDDGYTTYTCTICGESYTGDHEPALDHASGEWEVEVEPQVGVPGKEVLRCRRCGEEMESREIPALEGECKHSYDVEVVAPTCTEDGYMIYTCFYCQHSYKDDFVSSKGHDEGTWFVDVEPQIGVPGREILKCGACGEDIDSREIPALDDPDKPVNPDDPDKPVNPDDPDKPVNPDDPDKPVNPDETTATTEENGNSEKEPIKVTGCVSVSSGDALCLPIAFVAVFAFSRKKRK